MNNTFTFTEQVKYIIKNNSCPKYNDSHDFIFCVNCVCEEYCCGLQSFQNSSEYNIKIKSFCEKYLSDIREKKLKRILNE